MKNTIEATQFTYDRFQQLAPAAQAALRALGKSVADSGLDKGLTELVKIRVSQLNGCAFCTQFHLNLARQLGVDGTKLDQLTVWRDSGVFDGREKAALAWAEHLTAMAERPLPEGAGADLGLFFGEEEGLQLTLAIANITAWNRIAGGLRFPPPPRHGR